MRTPSWNKPSWYVLSKSLPWAFKRQPALYPMIYAACNYVILAKVEADIPQVIKAVHFFLAPRRAQGFHGKRENSCFPSRHLAWGSVFHKHLNNTQSSEKDRYQNLDPAWPETWSMNNLQGRIFFNKKFIHMHLFLFSTTERLKVEWGLKIHLQELAMTRVIPA